MSETPVHRRPRRLANWINPTEAKKVHSLIDKVYKRKNLEMAWEKVKANRGSGGIDGQTLEAFGEQLDLQLDRLARAQHRIAQCLLRLARASAIDCDTHRLTRRTAGCGPACPVVWEGRSCEASPYPDQ